ncbi:hypothetical protein AB0D10_05045 [Kitasatospora sp. NPDC048545]|uniref:hypothetical protein n=1 Tax=Kitasatospora sp. NPDC048545 TaxID=3157208 RepID=UPI0033FDE6DF
MAIPAARLPYKPAQGAPDLDDVKVVKSAADPCAIPADDSGNEAQLLDARADAGVAIVTFEFTNPCTTPVRYAFHITQAIGSASGRPGGPGVDATTAPIGPGKSISINVNINPDPALTSSQLKQLWVGVTQITKA